jgi:hypothetical protein
MFFEVAGRPERDPLFLALAHFLDHNSYTSTTTEGL